MSDFNSALPVRTENNGDVAAKIVDSTNPAQGLSVDAAGKIHTKLNDGAGTEITSQVNGAQQALDVGINVAGVQIDPRQVRALTATDVVTAEQGTSPWVVSATDLDIRDLVFATDKVDVTGSEVSLDATTLAALESITVQNGPGAAAVNIQDGGNSITVDAVDLDIRDLTATSDSVSAHLKDAAGNPFTNLNPLPVTITLDNAGTEVNDEHTSAGNIAVASSDTHDYTAINTFLLTQIEASASGKIKVEVSVETASGSNTFIKKFTQFNSTANPNTSLVLKAPITVATGVRVRVVITNRDQSGFQVYSTIIGQEIA